MDNVLTAAILPLLNATDKKKIKDAIVSQIVQNPEKYIDLSVNVDMNDIVNSDDIRFAISEAVVQGVTESNEFRTEILNHITSCVEEDITTIADDGYLVDRDKISETVTSVLVKSFKSSFKK